MHSSPTRSRARAHARARILPFLLLLSAFLLHPSALLCAPAPNLGLFVKPNGDVIAFSDARGINFPATNLFKIDGTTIPEPTVGGLNLWQIANPGSTGYIQLNTSGLPSVQTAATIVSSALPLSDATVLIKGSATSSKQARIEVDQNTASQTRTMYWLDYDWVPVATTGIQAITGPKTYNGLKLIVGTASGSGDNQTVAETETPTDTFSLSLVKTGGWAGNVTPIFRIPFSGTDVAFPKNGLLATVGRQPAATSNDSVASASTLDLSSVKGPQVDVTGTTTITAITMATGRELTLRFTGAAQLTNGASLLLPGGKNKTTSAGMTMTAIGGASSVVTIKDPTDSGGFSDETFANIYMGDSGNIGFQVPSAPVFTVGKNSSSLGNFLQFSDLSVQLQRNDGTGGVNLNTAMLTSFYTAQYPDKSGTFAYLDDVAAKLSLAGGTMTGQLIGRTGGTGAGTAPIKLVSGSLNTSPEAGAVEFITDALYFTQTTGPTRKSVVFAPSAGPITLTGTTAARSVAVPADANFTIARQDAAQTFNGVQTFVAPILGTPTSGDATNLTNLNGTQLTTGTIPFARTATGSYARAYNSANQSIGNSSVTALTFDSESDDSDTIHSTSSNTSRLTAKRAGWHNIFCSVEFASSAVGSRTVLIRKNGTTSIGAPGFAADTNGGATTNIAFGTGAYLAVNDYVEVIVFQNSGGNLNVTRSSDYSPIFGMSWASP